MSTHSWLSDAQDHDVLFVDNFYEAATDNEWSEVSEWPEKCYIFLWGLEVLFPFRGWSCLWEGELKGVRDIISAGIISGVLDIILTHGINRRGGCLHPTRSKAPLVYVTAMP